MLKFCKTCRNAGGYWEDGKLQMKACPVCGRETRYRNFTWSDWRIGRTWDAFDNLSRRMWLRHIPGAADLYLFVSEAADDDTAEHFTLDKRTAIRMIDLLTEFVNTGTLPTGE